MRCPTLEELPPPPAGKTGWPWTVGSPRCNIEKPPRISIVTPSFNQGQFLEETIRSVLLQNYPDLEYLIIDGGSRDESVAIIRRYERWLSYWVSEPDAGQSAAINKGWQRATGDILAYLNADDTYCPNALAAVAAAPTAGLLYGNCYVIDDQSRRVRRRALRQASLANVLAWSPSIPQPGMFVSHAALRDIGPLAVNLHYTMDYELCLRVMQKYPARHIRAYLANMRGHAAAKTARNPSQHVLEGLHVAEAFFARELPAPLARRRDFTLAILHLRLARVYAWQQHRHHARASVRSALRISVHPVVLGKSAVVHVMCILSNHMPRLRRWKHSLLQKFTK
jgi:glycosyltransferase involved in cell wall biosynthesis